MRQNIESAGPDSVVPEPPGEVSDGASVVLKAMRWAVRNLGVCCKGTALQELFRRELRAHPSKFRQDLKREEKEFRLEKAEGLAGAERHAEPPAEEGERSRRCEALIREMLAEIREPLPPGCGAGP